MFHTAYLTPVAAPVLTFAVFSVLSRGTTNSLDTSRVFTSLSLFTLLSEPLGALIMSLSTFMGAVGSFHRIQEFLMIPRREDARRTPTRMESPSEVETPKKLSISDGTDLENEKLGTGATSNEETTHTGRDAIIIRDGNFGWEKGQGPLLHSITLCVPKQKVTMIVGPVGCGKSTLLKAILGEVPIISGSVQVSSIEAGFCDQTPWHMNGTIQESIIGFQELDWVWYKSVICACALAEDFRQLSLGDQTPIGSQGISLSGGQSQRIVGHPEVSLAILLICIRHWREPSTPRKILSFSMML